MEQETDDVIIVHKKKIGNRSQTNKNQTVAIGGDTTPEEARNKEKYTFYLNINKWNTKSCYSIQKMLTFY